jgi:hypothetical protein
MRLTVPRRAVMAIALAACTAESTTQTVRDPTPTGTIPVQIGGEALVYAELATTALARRTGLMFRPTLAADRGMLFVFAQPCQLSFWMKDTAVPLSIAFLDDARRILNIADMTPFDTVTFHRSSGAARYALEVNQGWFRQRGILAGAQVNFTLPTGTTVDAGC